MAAARLDNAAVSCRGLTALPPGASPTMASVGDMTRPPSASFGTLMPPEGAPPAVVPASDAIVAPLELVVELLLLPLPSPPMTPAKASRPAAAAYMPAAPPGSKVGPGVE